MMAKRSDWSRPLPRPLVIPKVMTLRTLADVRVLIAKHLPKQCRERPTWRLVADRVHEAAAGRRHRRCRGSAADGARSRARAAAVMEGQFSIELFREGDSGAGLETVIVRDDRLAVARMLYRIACMQHPERLVRLCDKARVLARSDDSMSRLKKAWE
jgi:hypothetical protein